MSGPNFTNGAGPGADFNFDPNFNYDFSSLGSLDGLLATGDNSALATDTSATPMDIPQDMSSLFPPTSSHAKNMASFGSPSMPAPTPYYGAPTAPPAMPAAVPPQIPGFAGPFWDPRTSGWTFMPLAAPGPAASPLFPQPNKRKQSSDLSSLSEDSDSEPVQRRRKLNMRKRTRRTPSPIAEEDIFSSEDEPAPKKGKGRNDMRRKRNTGKKPSIAQTCICGSAKTKIPRPRNKFILWRTQNLKRIQKELDSTSQNAASKLAGEQWKALPNEGPGGKDEYARLAKIEAEKHARMYPGYRFVPQNKVGGLEDNKFGTATCTCGAYVANVRKSRAAGVELDPTVPDADGCSRVQPQAPAPQANMMPYAVYEPQPIIPVAPVNAFGLVLPGQRRSSRHQSQAVLPTTETSDVDAEMRDADASTKRRPSAILTPTNSPPAMNTRSRSISHEPETLPLPSVDSEVSNGWPAELEPDWDVLFGQDDDAAAAAPGESGSHKSSGQGRRRSPRHSANGRGSSGQNASRRSIRRSPRHSPTN